MHIRTADTMASVRELVDTEVLNLDLSLMDETDITTDITTITDCHLVKWTVMK